MHNNVDNSPEEKNYVIADLLRRIDELPSHYDSLIKVVKNLTNESSNYAILKAANQIEEIESPKTLFNLEKMNIEKKEISKKSLKARFVNLIRNIIQKS